jgi:hypothetical protein
MSTLKDFLKWTLLIGPILILGYILLFLPVNTWPIGDNYPDDWSLAYYFMPVLVVVLPIGALLGGALFILKEVAQGG